MKEETYRVAERHNLKTIVVANGAIRVPRSPLIAFVLVEAGPDIADDYIAERARAGDIVVTNDIPLADRALKAGAAVIAPDGRVHTADSIGMAMAQRAIMEQIRATGDIAGGPAPFSKAARSKFLSSLHEAALKSLRGRS